MRWLALLVGLTIVGCRPAADTGYTLLFLGRFAAARVGPYSWAPDPAHSRLIAFDGDLHVVRTVTDRRLSSPVAVARYPQNRLLITERTGEGVVFDTTGTPVREWESPFPASLYATDGSRIIASRSPYYVLFVAEDGSAPLLKAGRYHDTFERSGSDWRFDGRHIFVDQVGDVREHLSFDLSGFMDKR